MHIQIEILVRQQSHAVQTLLQVLEHLLGTPRALSFRIAGVVLFRTP